MAKFFLELRGESSSEVSWDGLGQNLPSFLMQYTSHGHWSFSLMLFANCKKREEKKDFNKKFLFSTNWETFGVTCICTCFRYWQLSNMARVWERCLIFSFAGQPILVRCFLHSIAGQLMLKVSSVSVFPTRVWESVCYVVFGCLCC